MRLKSAVSSGVLSFSGWVVSEGGGFAMGDRDRASARNRTVERGCWSLHIFGVFFQGYEDREEWCEAEWNCLCV